MVEVPPSPSSLAHDTNKSTQMQHKVEEKFIFISELLKWNAKMGHFLIHKPEE